MNNRFFIYLIMACFSQSIFSQVVVEDDFESGNFSDGWGVTAGVTLRSGSGANGSNKFASLSAYNATTGRELGARFDNVVPDGARDFVIEFFFKINNSSQRQFNIHVSDSSSAISSSAATINLRYQSNGWAAYANNTWNTIAGLNTVNPGVWYRMKLCGTGWGTPSASYSVELSDTSGLVYTSFATNIVYFQNGNPRTNTARFFLFTTVYGNNPGFDVDNVRAVITGTTYNETNLIINISGTYPHLAIFNNAGECGIGAVAEWAGKLWFITYPPHAPSGSADKLWSVDTNLNLLPYNINAGGTHACRMIHRESGQLIIGPYFINSNGQVRVILPSMMPGRLTAVTRHLIDPVNKVYFATMEEGFYEVNVNTFEVLTLHPDIQGTGSAILPGYHGKGAFTGQGRFIYSNNGEPGWSYNSDTNFNGPAGVLAENLDLDFTNGWRIVERKNFCEVTGPGSIYGAKDQSDPVWALGWDKRSVILKLLDNGIWYSFRLPKGSYTHDALHGWYTEWPRIREITNGFYLAHMHGLFYNFPGSFRIGRTDGITPICSYLKMPVDYCWWNGNLVLARDDASTTGNNKWAGQSHSALWFGTFQDLQLWGVPAGFGGFYMDDNVLANMPSDPFLINGFSECILHLRLTGSSPLTVSIQFDARGVNEWKELTRIDIPGNGYRWFKIKGLNAWWIRIVPLNDANGFTAYLHLSNKPRKPDPKLFEALAESDATNNYSDGILMPKPGDARWLQFAANIVDENGSVTRKYYEIGGSFKFNPVNDPFVENNLRTNYSLEKADFSVDAASVIISSGGTRYRLPKNGRTFDEPFITGFPRGIREVVTERNLLHAHGSFYELPRTDAGGVRKIRPICSHNKHISDFASWRGLFVIAGLKKTITPDNIHTFKASDGNAGLWFGNVDDLWKMGPPSGIGGPWKDTPVNANEPSDPYLFYGYFKKVLELSHTSDKSVTFTVEIDFAANGLWSEFGKFTVEPGKKLRHIFPEGYSAYWIRLKTDRDTIATATFYYGESLPEIGSITATGDGVLVTFNGQSGKDYTLLAATNVIEPLTRWIELTSGKFNGEKVEYHDKFYGSTGQKFYLIRINL